MYKKLVLGMLCIVIFTAGGGFCTMVNVVINTPGQHLGNVISSVALFVVATIGIIKVANK
jgi:hypothetical protein